MVRSARLVAVSLAISAIAGCSSPPATTSCTVGSSAGCAAGQTCEQVEGSADGACYAPVTVDGRVFDLATTDGIEGARVLAIDANGAAISTVVVSGIDGAYSLPVAAARDASGAPVSRAITLRVDAAGYQTFPTAPRTALPIDLGAAADVDGALVVRNAATDVGLLENGVVGAARIEGRVDALEPGGVLVVAEQGGAAVATAVSDVDGNFVVLDVPNGATHLTGYRAGLRITPVDLTVAAPASTGVVLTGATDGLATVTGSVNIVDGGGASSTSVILVVESTFVENSARGEAPAGLRAAPVSGAFTIEGVPPGRYVVLAAFENDRLVRDPDTSIGGTTIVHIEVMPGQTQVDLPESFKVTGALEVVSPGASTIEIVSDAAPTFVWVDDSSEDGYELVVYDAFGTLVHSADVPRVTGSAHVSYTWTDASLEPGMVYQFRATSFHDRTGRVYISRTEDLLGVFQFEP